MKFNYLNREYYVKIIPEQKIIIASTFDKDKVKSYKSPSTSENIKSINYSDTSSVSIPLAAIDEFTSVELESEEEFLIENQAKIVGLFEEQISKL